MTTSEQERIDRALRTFEAVTEHAVRYKELFHSMQDKCVEAQDELAVARRTARRQREIIARLEAQLGIDQDL